MSSASGSSVHLPPSPTSLPRLGDLPLVAEAHPEAGAVAATPPQLPSLSLPAEASQGSGSSAPQEELRPRRPRGRDRAGGAGSQRAREGIRLRPTAGAAVLPSSCAAPRPALASTSMGRPRRPPSSGTSPYPSLGGAGATPAFHRGGGELKDCGVHPDMRGLMPRHRKPPIQTSEGLKIDGLDSSWTKNRRFR
jgi:hypothetical protein